MIHAENSDGHFQPAETLIASGQQWALWQALVEQGKRFADMYWGSLLVLRSDNPDRHALAAHGLRELIEKLPQQFGVSMNAHDNQLGPKVKGLYDEWHTSVEKTICRSDGQWTGCIDGILKNFLKRMDTFFAWYGTIRPARREETAELIYKLDPNRRRLPKDLENANVKIVDSMRRYFIKIAHHNSQPSDSEFDGYLDEFERFLLDRLRRRTFDDREEIDQILGTTKLTVDLHTRTKIVDLLRKGYAQYEYFFDNLDSVAWVEPLRKEGFFRTPPETEKRGESESWVRWPESRYLRRVAEQNPDVVAEVFLKMDKTDNPFVHSDLVDAALKILGPQAASLAKKERRWIEKHDYVGSIAPYDYGKLVAHLAQSGELDEALNLARALLDIVPDARYGDGGHIDTLPEGMEFLGIPHPNAKLGNWFKQVLQEDMPVLVESAGVRAIKMLRDLLAKAIALSSEDPAGERPDDFSTIWFPAINRLEEHPTSQIRHPLAVAIRDGSMGIIRRDTTSLAECVRAIEQGEWHIFKRISLYLLAENLPHGSVLARERLLDRALMDCWPLAHEYFLLASKAFPFLHEGDWDQIVSWIEEGPRDLRDDAFTDEEKRREFIATLKCRQLHYLRDHLSGRHRDRYEALLSEVGQTGTREFANDAHCESWVGPTSPLSCEEIEAMSEDSLLDFLDNWKPLATRASPSPEGLGRILSAGVERNPNRYAKITSSLIGKDPTYVRNVLQGFEHAIRAKKTYEWEPIIQLMEWVINQHELEPDVAGKHDSRDHGWGWTRKTIGSLLSFGFYEGSSGIPFTVRTQLQRILEVLCEDSDPTPEDELKYGDRRDPSNLSLNVTRGCAFEALVCYSVWVRRNLQKRPHYAEKEAGWIEEMPEVREVLERHLDPEVDPSLAIRSVYGRNFAKLTWVDAVWAAGIANRLFGGQGRQDELQRAAWDAYLSFSHPYRISFEILHDIYALAVKRLSGRKDEELHDSSPGPRLAQHLIAFYSWGLLGAPEGQQILSDFFANASDALRARAVAFTGEWAGGIYGDGDTQALKRLQDLWGRRLETASTAQNPTDFSEEISAFGSWFASRRFDEGWALNQLLKVLEFTGHVEPSHKIAAVLADVTEEHLPKALQCLQSMAKGDKEGWELHSWRRDARRLLTRCLELTDPTVVEATKDFVHWLGARGLWEFGDLLAGKEAESDAR